jgi:hypothetical protein
VFFILLQWYFIFQFFFDFSFIPTWILQQQQQQQNNINNKIKEERGIPDTTGKTEDSVLL